MEETAANLPAWDFKLLIFVTVGVLIVANLFWSASRSRKLIHRWAVANRYEILQSERRYILTGKFFWTSTRGQTVFHVTVREPGGRERNGLVRCGGFITGLFGDDVEVRWEEINNP